VTSNAVLPVRSASGGQLAAQVPARADGSQRALCPNAGRPLARTNRQSCPRLLAPPFRLDRPSAQHQRRFGLTRCSRWLEAQPGRSCRSAGRPAEPGWTAERTGGTFLSEWLKRTGRIHPSATTGYQTFGAGLALLICGEFIRPDIAWLPAELLTDPLHWPPRWPGYADPDGFAMLHALTQKSSSGKLTSRGGIVTIAYILAAKGGSVENVTVGDCLSSSRSALPNTKTYAGPAKGPTSTHFCHTLGVLPPDAPSTARMFSPIYQVGMYQGQLQS